MTNTLTSTMLGFRGSDRFAAERSCISLMCFVHSLRFGICVISERDMRLIGVQHCFDIEASESMRCGDMMWQQVGMVSL